MKLKCFESTDSNGIEQYLIPLEDGSFIAIPKKRMSIDIEDYVPKAFHDKTCEALCHKHRKEVEALERKRGEWIFNDPLRADFECSECLERNDICTNFCPNCGADMRKREDK